MALGWFIAPYKRRILPQMPGRIIRYCAMDDFTTQIRADGGNWTEAEVVGQQAIVKVNASAATLTTIGATAGFLRIPVTALDSPLSSLTTGQRDALRTRIVALGFTLAELDAAFPGDTRNRTLRQILDFIRARPRRKVRFDGNTIIDDGPNQPVRPLAELDAAVR